MIFDQLQCLFQRTDIQRRSHSDLQTILYVQLHLRHVAGEGLHCGTGGGEVTEMERDSTLGGGGGDMLQLLESSI